ncbi:SOS response-associated peptidase [Winogradskyella bathintestinalis]|uniref:Abasic site processing protein n=1 Tax=Winogradskyella bathintestinalis TaxID=3035208 RepID=A0ABT7ZVS4_9FLAO|nr:SOS response-associated peptidase [Winogradskyella bathintestinalis]MDN3493101.1 SOS response-associated peptidase [Winogradskyella bathintestinalis]
MCYDIKASYEAQLKRAKRRGDKRAIEEIIENLIPYTDLPIFHASGFKHPEMLIYPDASTDYPIVATWGMVPPWISDQDQIKSIWNKTLNARGETIFEKPSFKTAALHNRCLIYIDGFYEHHHFDNKVYPFFIQRQDEQPIALAGLWNEWENPANGGKMTTFSIVTTKGNSLMSKIHNNPKLKGPRMPLILSQKLEDEWLKPIVNNDDKLKIKEITEASPSVELKAHTVNKLRGKDYLGNTECISKAVNYKELIF